MRAKRVRALRKMVELTSNAPEVTTYTEGPQKQKFYMDFKDGKFVPVNYVITGTIRMNNCVRRQLKTMKQNYKKIMHSGLQTA